MQRAFDFLFASEYSWLFQFAPVVTLVLTLLVTRDLPWKKPLDFLNRDKH